MVLNNTKHLFALGTGQLRYSNDKKMNNHVELDSSTILSEHNKINMEQDNKKVKKNNRKKQCTHISTSEKLDAVCSIDQKDLDELRAVYKKCKAVMLKMETKYGHLLNFKDTCSNSEDDSGEKCSDKCNCSTNKKIIFNDEGEVILTESSLESHICPKKLKRKFSDAEVNVNNVQVEYEMSDIMSDDIETLSKILQDPDLETTYRDKVIHKMKLLKQEYTDELRFNKKALVAKIKSNPDEIFEFKGANLNSLPGYFG